MHIKKVLQILFTSISALALLLVFTVTASAEDSQRSPKSTRSPKIEDLRKKEDKFASREAELKTRVASRTAELNKKMDKMASRASDIASRSAQRWEDRCKKLNEKATEKLTRYEKNRTEHINNYMQARKRLEEVITRLESRGYDVSKLKTDLTQLNTLIKKASDDFSEFTASLKTAQSTASCNRTESVFSVSLKASQDKLETARASLTAVRVYYQNTIRPDILAVKSQRPSGSPKASGRAAPSSTAAASPTATPVPSASVQ